MAVGVAATATGIGAEIGIPTMLAGIASLTQTEASESKR